MGDRVRPLLDIFEKHFPNSNTDDFTRMGYANDILFADAFGGSALGIWKIEGQLIALETIERALNQITGKLEVLVPSVRNTLLSPVDQSMQQAGSPFLEAIEILLRQVAAARRVAKEAVEPGHESGERTTYRAAYIAFWCQNIWTWETGEKAPRQMHATRSNPPFGRFLQDVFNELKIPIQPSSALDALVRAETLKGRKEKPRK